MAIKLWFVPEQKNYAFSSSSAAQPPSAAADNNNSAVQVKLSGQLEEAMLDLIKKEMLGTCAVGYVSQRLNARKLTVCVYLYRVL